MICARCNEEIKGKPEPVIIETGSSVSATVYICPIPCRPAPQQTYPVK
ncbi:hypothetical protein SAMN04490357_1062 [Streptomyces misionensis]|uniref:Uncharacterized protein n=1 Tax=Streptomyces misionensis TaxID=67331 RepID=A0A1H4PDQ9_9ACTN|nr:hypothetical protein SAMN04490357_1062 [Streptomyces misionensis]